MPTPAPLPMWWKPSWRNFISYMQRADAVHSCIGPLRCFKMWLQSVGAAKIFQKRPDAKDKRHDEQHSGNEGNREDGRDDCQFGKAESKIFIRAPFYSDMNIVPGQIRLRCFSKIFWL